MNKFTGFTSSETFTQIPDSFLRLINEIDDVAELKITLYAIYRIEHIEGNFRGLGEADFSEGILGLSVEQIQLGFDG